jgi:DNA-binding CsgD family transcriptional regulator
MARRTWDQYEKYILQQWPLTRREVQVTLECIKGKRNKEIAALLGIGAETVNKTLDHIYRTTGVNGRDQLVAKLLIADIENTPLQQSVTLAGEGAVLVAAGFLSTLYASRAERKRPRSLRSASRSSRRVEATSESRENTAALRDPDDSDPQAPGQTARPDNARRSDGAETPPNRTESLPWMISADSLVEVPATEL